MLLLRVFRPDKLVPAVQAFVSQCLGPDFVKPHSCSVGDALTMSTCDTPIVLMLSPGSDPVYDLLQLADQEGFGKRLKIVSLGQRQGPIAEAAVAEAVDQGGWVLLQNCHLAESWLPSLEHLCANITPDRTHPTFRLWLTTAVTAAFPAEVLQNAIKLTHQAPRGIRPVLQQLYDGIDEAWLEGSKQPYAFKKLLFGLSFFHALVLVRPTTIHSTTYPAIHPLKPLAPGSSCPTARPYHSSRSHPYI